jgi:transposase InsO family protein
MRWWSRNLGLYTTSKRKRAGPTAPRLDRPATSKMPRRSPASHDAPVREPITDLRIQTVLSEYQRWAGSFVDFCKHLREHCCIEYGATTVSSILARHGLRAPRRRPGRSPDEKALRESFETFFPGAQWVGDGHEITFEFNGEPYTFNLELAVDTDSAALVGGHLGRYEDSSAVVRAFHDGVTTTGSRPLAFLLDNRECNHTADVQAALDDSLLIRSTPGRAQNKAHVEGAFGLFQQTVPPLQINADNSRDLVAAIVALIVQTWARTLNGKKRRARGNRSRTEVYRDAQPTQEQIEHAREQLAKRQRQQEKARQTLLARQDPVKRELLTRAFRELGLTDPDGNVQLAIARYPINTLVDAIAVFKRKKAASTLPEGAGARYLLGIVVKVNADNEQRHLVDELLQLRLQARDLLLDHLVTERDVLQKAESMVTTRIDLFIDRALATDSLLTRLFWLRSTAEQLLATPETKHTALLRHAAARITTNYRVPASTRQQAICHLTALVIPVL